MGKHLDGFVSAVMHHPETKKFIKHQLKEFAKEHGVKVATKAVIAATVLTGTKLASFALLRKVFPKSPKSIIKNNTRTITNIKKLPVNRQVYIVQQLNKCRNVKNNKRTARNIILG
jgi:hypothetical protein